MRGSGIYCYVANCRISGVSMSRVGLANEGANYYSVEVGGNHAGNVGGHNIVTGNTLCNNEYGGDDTYGRAVLVNPGGTRTVVADNDGSGCKGGAGAFIDNSSGGTSATKGTLYTLFTDNVWP